MTTTKLGRGVALAAVYGERYGVSLAFLCLAGFRLHRLLAAGPAERAEIAAAPIATVVNQLIWVQLYGYTGLLLLFGRRVMAPPRQLQDIALPMATTFFYLAYAITPWLPAGLSHNVCPGAWREGFAAAGVVLNLTGLWIAIWAAVHLGRSFGVLIEVRKVVTAGAYRWVRHPMYSGYVLLLAGFALTNVSPAYLVLVPLHIALLLYRARLEEARLADFSPEYAEYRRRTGFVFPRIMGK